MSKVNANFIINNSEQTFIDTTLSSVNLNNLEPNIIFRDGSNASLSLLQLSNLNEVHVYTNITPSNLLYLRSSLVNNALYEVVSLTAGDGVNIDFRLFPNGTTYTNEMIGLYWLNAEVALTWDRVQVTDGAFYFDHVGGTGGTAPMNRFVFTTGPTNKYVQYEGFDSHPGMACGYSRWTNNTRSWDWAGFINYGPTLNIKRAYIRRIG